MLIAKNADSFPTVCQLRARPTESGPGAFSGGPEPSGDLRTHLPLLGVTRTERTRASVHQVSTKRLRPALRTTPENDDIPAGAGMPRSGAEGNRTLDLFHAMEALSQLSYGPKGTIIVAPRLATTENPTVPVRGAATGSGGAGAGR